MQAEGAAGPAARIVFPFGAAESGGPGGVPFRPAEGYNDYTTAPMVFVGTFSADECARITALSADLSFAEGRLVNPLEDYRSTQVGWLFPSDDTRWIYERIAEVFQQVNRWYRFELAGIDVLQLGRYGVNDGFDWHVDTGRGTTSTRKLSLSLQLSSPDEYEGGGLEFCPLGEIAMSRPQGTVIVFPSFCAHRVVRISRGNRLSLVAWANGPVFR